MLLQETQKKNTGIFTGQNVRLVINCVECEKPRCVFATSRLTERQETHAVITKSSEIYTCGAAFAEPGEFLYNVCQTKVALQCGDHVEFAYYVKYPASSICCQCGLVDGERSPELLLKYKIVLPLCNSCKSKGKEPVFRAPKK